jgi:hypothetical protein
MRTKKNKFSYISDRSLRSISRLQNKSFRYLYSGECLFLIPKFAEKIIRPFPKTIYLCANSTGVLYLRSKLKVTSLDIPTSCGKWKSLCSCHFTTQPRRFLDLFAGEDI